MKIETKIRKYFQDLGCRVKISRDGHVVFKRPDDSGWREGRWVSEYREIDGVVDRS